MKQIDKFYVINGENFDIIVKFFKFNVEDLSDLESTPIFNIRAITRTNSDQKVLGSDGKVDSYPFKYSHLILIIQWIGTKILFTDCIYISRINQKMLNLL